MDCRPRRRPRLGQQPWWEHLNPVQRQLLGDPRDGWGEHLWGHFPQTTPVYRELATRGQLEPKYPPLIPDAPDAG